MGQQEGQKSKQNTTPDSSVSRIVCQHERRGPDRQKSEISRWIFDHRSPQLFDEQRTMPS